MNSAAQSTPANRESAITQASATRQGVLSDVGKMGNVFQRQKEVEDDRVPSADDGSISCRFGEISPLVQADWSSAYNPPSASTPDPAEPDMNSLELPTWESSHFGNTSIAAKAFHTDRATLSLREQVKDALRSLKLHNIKYNELVGEGVEPSLLRGLYEDIDQKLVQAKLRSPVVEVGQISDPQKIALQTPQEGQELPGRSSKYAGQNLHPAPTTTDKSSTSIPVKTTSETQANSSVAGLTKTSPSPVVSTEKAAVASSSSNVAVERKDRIAQLLAAKTGKAVPARLAPEIQPHVPARILKPDSSVDTATKPASLPQKPPAPPEKPPAPPKKPPALPEKPSVPPKKPPALPEKPPVPAPEPLVKPKNKAQTELLRQKMEALKREALAKSQAQSALNEDSVASSPTSATPSFAPQPQPLGPTVSTADVGSSGLGSQIPGLFMMNEVYPSNPDITNERADHALAEKVDDPVSINSTATSVGPGMSAEFETDLVQSPGGHILPVRLPQKRPLPSDSFDESMPSLKRPFGRKHSDHRVEIVVSDAESEGEVEDVEMELDEESDEEKQAPEDDGVPAVSVRQTNMRNLPPLTDIPSAKQTLQFAGAISTPTSAAVQTPGRENDNEELWKAKYQEIELMRKKIAEMEERHKAKQNATRAISPKAAGRTAPPVIRTSLARPSQAASPGLPKPSVNAKADLSSNALQSPVLTPSGPEELPGTPSTPLDAIKEPLKAEDLRQQLLRRKPTKEETPSFAEMKLRKAQLAEKRAKLADLRREAEKHEEEILEESKLLDAQLQAGLNGEDAYEQRPFHANGDVAEDTRTKGLAASDVLPQTHRDEQGVSVEGSPSAAKASRVSQVEQQPNEAASRALPAAGDIVLQPSDEDGIVRDVAAFERVVPSVEQDIDHAQELLGDSLSTPADESVEIGTVPQQDNFPAVLLAETGPMEVKSPSPWIEDKTTDETRPDPVDSNFFDEDGSVSMSDGASEDYEPAEPDQMGGDQPENDSEFYEPADVALPVAAQLSPSQRDEVVEVDQPATNGQMQSTSTLEKTVLPTLVHDAEDGMQLTEPDVINKPQIISQPHGDDRIDQVRGRTSLSPHPNMAFLQIPLSTSHFTPYETPRRNLKNFRYYDHFPAMVSSGYKSLTFSNNIDPGKPFCPTELAGDTCHDPICEEQHFRQVEMTGACKGSSPYHRDTSWPNTPSLPFLHSIWTTANQSSF